MLSIEVPAYNEQQVLPQLHKRLLAVLDGIHANAEILYVSDGSKDATIEVLKQLQTTDGRVTVVDLSRNSEKEIALTAGIDYARGDAIGVIDADLQDPPEPIPKMLDHFRAGYDVVYAKRISRAGESLLKRLLSSGSEALSQIDERAKDLAALNQINFADGSRRCLWNSMRLAKTTPYSDRRLQFLGALED